MKRNCPTLQNKKAFRRLFHPNLPLPHTTLPLSTPHLRLKVMDIIVFGVPTPPILDTLENFTFDIRIQ
jgi:hypothetical protein